MEINDDYNPRKSIEKLTANLEQPDKFAKIFCEATKTQKTIDDALKVVIKSLIQHDKETRDFIKGILRELEKEDWLFVLKKFGFFGWTVIIAVISAVAGAIARGHL